MENKQEWLEMYECAVKDNLFDGLDLPAEIPESIKMAIGKAICRGWDDCYNFYMLD